MTESAVVPDRNILFAGLAIPAIDRTRALNELRQIAGERWIWDDYRATSMLPLMTLQGKHDRNGMIDLNIKSPTADFIWTDFCPPTIQAYFEEHIFTWIKPRPRVVVLRTAAKNSNNEHIDCERKQLGSRQLKFRMVLSGPVSSLYFLTSNGNIHVPEIETPFLIDGGWPHGMNNDSTTDKITICLGAPWNGAEVYPKLHSVLSKANLAMPENIDRFFRK